MLSEKNRTLKMSSLQHKRKVNGLKQEKKHLKAVLSRLEEDLQEIEADSVTNQLRSSDRSDMQHRKESVHRILLLLLLSVILVMLLAINRQIALSVRCLVVKAMADGLAKAEEAVAVKMVEKVMVEVSTLEKAGGSPKQVEVTLKILVFVFVVVLRATKPNNPHAQEFA